MNRTRIILYILIFTLLIFITCRLLTWASPADDYQQMTSGIATNSTLADLPDYDSSLYSIDEPYIATDIYQFNPLSAYVAFPIAQDATFSYTVTGKDQFTDFTYSDDTAQSENLVIPIIGLYANYNNQIELIVNYADGSSATTTVEITTDNLEAYISPTIEVDYSLSNKQIATDALEGGLIFDNRINGYDINGDIRVALEIKDLDWQGNALRINTDNSFMMGTQDYIYNMSLTGKVFFEYQAPDGYYMNHDYISAENGYTYVIISPDEDNLTTTDSGYKRESFIAVYQTAVDQLPIEILDINSLVENNQINSINTFSAAQDELVHLNSLTYHQPTDTLIASSQSQNAIIGINPNNGEMKWIIKNPETVNTNQDQVLEVIGDDYLYTSGQHSVNVTSNPQYDDGNQNTIELTVYDNRFCTDLDGNNIVSNVGGFETVCADQDSSQLLVYRVDPLNMTVEMIDHNHVDGYYSSIRSSWYQSPDYKYNYITYGDLGQFISTDSDFNPLFNVQSDEADEYYQNMYRTRVITNQQISSILQLENQY